MSSKSTSLVSVAKSKINKNDLLTIKNTIKLTKKNNFHFEDKKI